MATKMTLTQTATSWDREAALNSVDGDTELLVELAEIFLEGSQALLEQVGHSIDAANPIELHHAAHTMKGSIANFFAQDARDSAQALEMSGRAGHFDGARETFGKLTQQLQCFEAELAEFIAAKGVY
jgi:two-component system sensor histidine kinase/response regulator